MAKGPTATLTLYLFSTLGQGSDNSGKSLGRVLSPDLAIPPTPRGDALWIGIPVRRCRRSWHGLLVGDNRLSGRLLWGSRFAGRGLLGSRRLRVQHLGVVNTRPGDPDSATNLASRVG